ncbi:unnamed protein product [Adineta ricciae]|uniref:Uncharacterized protein n=1 Tax=Adineta ricciae TaxID=249248 RepID=A0A816H5F1_ADIRI|nr:unnamed protein product [Adineta ricciae]
MQRRFTGAFERHVHIRKNLILQILFLFLNFAVFWLPAEIITLYTKSRLLRDTVQVTKSLNILLDPLIITGFDTRFSSAAQHFLSKWRLDEFMCFFGANRQNLSMTTSSQLMTIRSGATLQRLKLPPNKRDTQQLQAVTWNLADDDDITVLESNSNHVSHVHDKQLRVAKPVDTRVTSKRKSRQHSQTRLGSPIKRQKSLVIENHRVSKRH